MTVINVRASGEYPVMIGRGILRDAGRLIGERLRGRAVCLVSDMRVYSLYGDTVTESLEREGIAVTRFTFPAGEASKCMSTYGALMESLAEARLSRKDALVALGGGVTGDLAGFAAATYLRGVDFFQIPTTLLAAVDSSVGGKTGIDLAVGKNLCGAFHQPRLVLCDTDTLTTLEDRDVLGGMAEVIKYGVIRDASLFSLLTEERERILSACREGDLDGVLEGVISASVGIKRDVVEADEFESGLRCILNYGHTAAHAVESLSGYAVPHGIAVAVGMCIAVGYARGRGLVTAKEESRILRTVREYGLPATAAECAIAYGLSPDTLTPCRMAEAALSDKKAAGGSITLVLPTGIGSCRAETVPSAELISFMSATPLG